MIPLLAQQSIQTKLKLQSVTMLGNYEFYYAAGLLCQNLGLLPQVDLPPKELYDFLRTQTDGKEISDPVTAHLAKMIHFYIPEDAYDEQMKELFRLGVQEMKQL